MQSITGTMALFSSGRRHLAAQEKAQRVAPRWWEIKGIAVLNGTLKGWQRCRRDKKGPDQRGRGSESVTGMYSHCTEQCRGSEAEAAAGVIG